MAIPNASGGSASASRSRPAIVTSDAASASAAVGSMPWRVSHSAMSSSRSAASSAVRGCAVRPHSAANRIDGRELVVAEPRRRQLPRRALLLVEQRRPATGPCAPPPRPGCSARARIRTRAGSATAGDRRSAAPTGSRARGPACGARAPSSVRGTRASAPGSGAGAATNAVVSSSMTMPPASAESANTGSGPSTCPATASSNLRDAPPFSTCSPTRPASRIDISSIGVPVSRSTVPASTVRSSPCATSHSSSLRGTDSKSGSAARRSTMASDGMGTGRETASLPSTMRGPAAGRHTFGARRLSREQAAEPGPRSLRPSRRGVPVLLIGIAAVTARRLWHAAQDLFDVRSAAGVRGSSADGAFNALAHQATSMTRVSRLAVKGFRPARRGDPEGLAGPTPGRRPGPRRPDPTRRTVPMCA